MSFMVLFVLRYILLVIYLIVTGAIAVFVSLFRPFNPQNAGLYRVLLVPVSRWLLGITVEFRRREIFENAPQAVYIGNHQHNIDLYIFGEIIGSRTVCVGKNSLLWIPIFGQLFYLSGQIPLNRGNIQKAHSTMDQVEEIIRKKAPLSIFILPEGTRSHGKGLGPFKKGAFRVAINTGLPIIPICVTSFHKSINLKKWRAGHVIVEFLPPIPTQGLSLEDIPELMSSTRALMEKKIEAMDAELARSRPNVALK